MKLCCEVIDSLFVSLDPEVVVGSYSNELRQGLGVDNASVQLLCLAEIKRLPIDWYNTFVTKDESAISSMIHLITCEPLQVALSSVSALSRLGVCQGGSSLLLSKHLEEIKVSMTKSDVVRFRFYELLTNIASSNSVSLPAVVNTGLLHQLLTELFEESQPDILAQMNCIELLTNLAMTNHGFTWLTEEGVLDKLEVLLSKINSESILALLLPGLLVFFGCLAKSRPEEICGKYKLFVLNLFSSTNSLDMTLRGIALETLAQVGSTVNGKLILSQFAEMDLAIKETGTTIRESVTETRVRALGALATLLELKPQDHTPELLSLTESWFTNLVTDPFKLILSICNQPFESLRLGGHKIIISLACQPWGQHLMKDSATFQEYLLNRAIETELEWKYSKFKIVETLLECSFTEEIFGSEYYQKLVQYHRAGPIYVECESAVALEGGS